MRTKAFVDLDNALLGAVQRRLRRCALAAVRAVRTTPITSSGGPRVCHGHAKPPLTTDELASVGPHLLGDPHGDVGGLDECRDRYADLEVELLGGRLRDGGGQHLIGT